MYLVVSRLFDCIISWIGTRPASSGPAACALSQAFPTEEILSSHRLSLAPSMPVSTVIDVGFCCARHQSTNKCESDGEDADERVS